MQQTNQLWRIFRWNCYDLAVHKYVKLLDLVKHFPAITLNYFKKIGVAAAENEALKIWRRFLVPAAEVDFTDRLRVKIRQIWSILLTAFVSKSATAFEFSKSKKASSGGRLHPSTEFEGAVPTKSDEGPILTRCLVIETSHTSCQKSKTKWLLIWSLAK